ncbi:MAG: hypothetical protein KatS3mg068_0769 [Candidatus Sericytochromatia bacterium]|nr:MAG: hypothetical protein KatS3mg068_0769 [Candidatus Sericytochromatia bacterium]
MIKKAFVSFLTILVCSTLVYAENTDPKKAIIKSLENKVELKYGVSEWREARINQLLRPGTNIRTGAMSKVEIMYGDGSLARIGSRSSFTVLDMEARSVELNSGKMWFKVVKKSVGLNIKTPSAVAAITGTEGFAKFEDNDKEGSNINNMIASNNINKIAQGISGSFAFGLVEGTANLFKLDINGNPTGEALQVRPGDIITFSNGVFSINNVGIESILNQNRDIATPDFNANNNQNNNFNNNNSDNNSNNNNTNNNVANVNNNDNNSNFQNYNNNNNSNNFSNTSPNQENLSPSNVNTQQIPSMPNVQQNQNLNTSPTTGDLQIIIK